MNLKLHKYLKCNWKIQSLLYCYIVSLSLLIKPSLTLFFTSLYFKHFLLKLFVDIAVQYNRKNVSLELIIKVLGKGDRTQHIKWIKICVHKDLMYLRHWCVVSKKIGIMCAATYIKAYWPVLKHFMTDCHFTKFSYQIYHFIMDTIKCCPQTRTFSTKTKVDESGNLMYYFDEIASIKAKY